MEVDIQAPSEGLDASRFGVGTSHKHVRVPKIMVLDAELARDFYIVLTIP